MNGPQQQKPSIAAQLREREKKKLVDNNGGFACTFETNDALS